MKKITEDWLKAAKDDLDVIERIIKDEHLSHIVAFHAQQSLEKLFKAVIEEYDIETQKIHKLVTLYGRIESILEEEMDLQLLKTLDSLYIEARYPGELGLLPNGRPTQDDAKRFHAYACTAFERISKYLG
jgi:HEPN domain-containing protein